MADEIASLKQLQAGLNATFEAIYSAKDAKTAASAKEQLAGLSQATFGAAVGPAFAVIGMSTTPVHYMAIKIAIDLGIFELVVSKPQSLSELVQATGADAKLLRRILFMVTGIGWLKQSEADKWESSPVTPLVTDPALKSWLIVHFETRMHVYAEFPAWLKRHNYKTSWASDTDNIWSEINGAGDFWAYTVKNPEYSQKFDTAMSLQERFPPEMAPPYPFADEASEIKKDKDSVTLVDVGGGAGQAIERFRQTHPDLPGRFILQDLPKSIEALDPAQIKAGNFEAQSHDFFKEQPVKGAKYYHLRRILHDWNDTKCHEILTALRPALDPAYSKLLVVDFVLPDFSPTPVEPAIDLMMMTAVNGCERTQSDWHALLGKAGFKIDRILFADAGRTAVIEASVA